MDGEREEEEREDECPDHDEVGILVQVNVRGFNGRKMRTE